MGERISIINIYVGNSRRCQYIELQNSRCTPSSLSYIRIFNLAMYLFSDLVYLCFTLMQNAAEKPPIFLPSWTAMFVINSFIVVWVLVIGFGFGGWASMTNFVKQVDTFGLFAKCYQCKPPTPPVAPAPHHWSWVWTTWPNFSLSFTHSPYFVSYMGK